MGSADLIEIALREDLAEIGDITTRYFVDPSRRAGGKIIAKEECVLAGVEAAEETFRRVDPSLEISRRSEDGARLKAGEVALELKGRAASLLTAERTALNFLQRLSGIATMTSRYVAAVAGTKARILDTRKTTPGWRWLEKKAVAAGGGVNHRMGLYDMVMVKDNHLAAGEGETLQARINQVKAEHPGIRIELEADTLEQVRLFLSLQSVDIILLDNMPIEHMRRAVEAGAGKVTFEASGGITLERIGEIARTGVDFVSVGALTHSVRAADLSLELSHDPARS